MSSLSTKHMVLGLVVERPSYGYALQVEITNRFGFLNLARSGVYGTLERLEREGMVEQAGQKLVRPSDTPKRTLFRATPKGEAEFKKWMAAPSARPLVRDELQAKLGLATPEDLPELHANAEAQLAACVADLASIAKPPLAMAQSTETSWPDVTRILSAHFRIYILQGMADWLTTTVAIIEARMAQHGEPER
jgi:DNA-binding PadR family transcriptional regulator